jgi:hypothetical protein
VRPRAVSPRAADDQLLRAPGEPGRTPAVRKADLTRKEQRAVEANAAPSPPGVTAPGEMSRVPAQRGHPTRVARAQTVIARALVKRAPPKEHPEMRDPPEPRVTATSVLHVPPARIGSSKKALEEIGTSVRVRASHAASDHREHLVRALSGPRNPLVPIVSRAISVSQIETRPAGHRLVDHAHDRHPPGHR